MYGVEIDPHHEARVAEHKRCVAFVKQFAQTYVDRWVDLQGDSAKAAGWAILQAAADLEGREP